jgi:lysozyme
MKKHSRKKNYFQFFLIFSMLILLPAGLIIYKTNDAYLNKIYDNYAHTNPERYLATTMAKPYLKPHIKKYDLHGIDVSKHQGKIQWHLVKHPDTSKKIDFVFIRASYGTNKDKLFHTNWVNATSKNFTLGAYHYYWANTNSSKQAKRFIETVELKNGDLPPVLDIEKLPEFQSKSNWLKGIKNWLNLVEMHYGVKPIIYTSDGFYKHHLETDPFFKEYPRLWIANYNNIQQPNSNWHFWQYSDKVKITGIKGAVDINVFKNDAVSFNDLLKK